jgi:hypothetical protein
MHGATIEINAVGYATQGRHNGPKFSSLPM